MCVLDNLKYVPSTYLQMENPIIWEYFATNINDPEGWWYDHVMWPYGMTWYDPGFDMVNGCSFVMFFLWFLCSKQWKSNHTILHGSWFWMVLKLCVSPVGVKSGIPGIPSKPTNQPFTFSDKSKLAIPNNENQQGSQGFCQIEWESRSQFFPNPSVPGIWITGGMSSKIWENVRKRQMRKLVMLPEIRFLSYFYLSFFVVIVQQKGYLRTNKSLVQWQVILRCRNHCWLGDETTYLRPKNWGCLIRTGDGINGIITRTSILVLWWDENYYNIRHRLWSKTSMYGMLPETAPKNTH